MEEVLEIKTIKLGGKTQKLMIERTNGKKKKKLEGQTWRTDI